MADSKHTVGDLRQLQALPLRLKIMLTRQRIREWYDHWDRLVACDGRESAARRWIYTQRR